MKCPNCGAEAGGRFCSYCGSELPRTDNRPVTNFNNTNNTTHNVTNIYYVNQAPTYQTPVIRAPEQPVYVPLNFEKAEKSGKSKNTALLLCFFTGVFGGHQFYAGRWGMGLLYLLTGGLFGIGALVNFIQIIVNNFRDSEGLPICGKVTWAKWIILICVVFSILSALESSQY